MAIKRNSNISAQAAHAAAKRPPAAKPKPTAQTAFGTRLQAAEQQRKTASTARPVQVAKPARPATPRPDVQVTPRPSAAKPVATPTPVPAAQVPQAPSTEPVAIHDSPSSFAARRKAS